MDEICPLLKETSLGTHSPTSMIVGSSIPYHPCIFTIIYLDLVDFYGKFVGKIYNRPMDAWYVTITEGYKPWSHLWQRKVRRSHLDL